jgi:hypothetical protein
MTPATNLSVERVKRFMALYFKLFLNLLFLLF